VPGERLIRFKEVFPFKLPFAFIESKSVGFGFMLQQIPELVIAFPPFAIILTPDVAVYPKIFETTFVVT
jgi:hypothetical protein